MSGADTIDQLARHQARAGKTSSRRQALRAFVAGVVALATGGISGAPVAAACRERGQSCNSSGKPCCGGQALRCKDGVCRCRNGHEACTNDGVCTDIERSPDHCGACGKQCPPAKPCCFKGKCTPKCGDTCCANCFVELLENGTVKPNSELCCAATGGTICRPAGGTRDDDQCCRSDEQCLQGKCCADDLYGETQCGGTCCRQAACCNGKACCRRGQVCARRPGASKDSCVTADRTCTVATDCFQNEGCHGGACCAAPRVCTKTTPEAAFCCAANEFCEFNNTPIAQCTLVGHSASTYRGNRVRP